MACFSGGYSLPESSSSSPVTILTLVIFSGDAGLHQLSLPSFRTVGNVRDEPKYFVPKVVANWTHECSWRSNDQLERPYAAVSTATRAQTVFQHPRTLVSFSAPPMLLGIMYYLRKIIDGANCDKHVAIVQLQNRLVFVYVTT
jgi:hypothetical protein